MKANTANAPATIAARIQGERFMRRGMCKSAASYRESESSDNIGEIPGLEATERAKTAVTTICLRKLSVKASRDRVLWQ